MVVEEVYISALNESIGKRRQKTENRNLFSHTTKNANPCITGRSTKSLKDFYLNN
jgi:hypothetical protein